MNKGDIHSAKMKEGRTRPCFVSARTGCGGQRSGHCLGCCWRCRASRSICSRRSRASRRPPARPAATSTRCAAPPTTRPRGGSSPGRWRTSRRRRSGSWAPGSPSPGPPLGPRPVEHHRRPPPPRPAPPARPAHPGTRPEVTRQRMSRTGPVLTEATVGFSRVQVDNPYRFCGPLRGVHGCDHRAVRALRRRGRGVAGVGVGPAGVRGDGQGGWAVVSFDPSAARRPGPTDAVSHQGEALGHALCPPVIGFAGPPGVTAGTPLSGISQVVANVLRVDRRHA